MKDRATGEVLLQGKLHDGLYRFNLLKTSASDLKSISPTPSLSKSKNSPVVYSTFSRNAATAVSSSESVQSFGLESSQFSSTPSVRILDLWHRKLDHPASPIVKKMLTNCNIKFQSNENSNFLFSLSNGKKSLLTISNF